MRQRDLASTLGVREETLAMWERGQATPLARHYGTIVRFLGYDPGPAGEDLPGRLHAIRRRLGLTQEEFGALVGLDEGSLCRWESGSRRPSRWMAARVEATLEKLEENATTSAGTEPSPYGQRPHEGLSFFDLTRWRRSPPPGLLPEKLRTLGDRLRRRRLELGLSQAEVGNQLAVGRATIYRWERGEDVPLEHEMALVRFLGTEPVTPRRANPVRPRQRGRAGQK